MTATALSDSLGPRIQILLMTSLRKGRITGLSYAVAYFYGNKAKAHRRIRP